MPNQKWVCGKCGKSYKDKVQAEACEAIPEYGERVVRAAKLLHDEICKKGGDDCGICRVHNHAITDSLWRDRAQVLISFSEDHDLDYLKLVLFAGAMSGNIKNVEATLRKFRS
jgi:hypothetical protein